MSTRSTITWPLLALGAVATAQNFTFRGIGIPQGATGSSARSIASVGASVVGAAQVGGGRVPIRWAWASVSVMSGFAQSSDTAALATSQLGDRVAGASGAQAFQWKDALAYLFGSPAVGATDSRGTAVSIYGKVFGWAQVGTRRSAFAWESGVATDLGGELGNPSSSMVTDCMGSGGVFCGEATGPDGRLQAFRRDSVGNRTDWLGDLPGGDFRSRALGISNGGVFVVGWGLTEGNQEAFWWSPVVGMVPLGDLEGGEVASEARAVSQDGTMAVGVGTTQHGPEAFVWTPRLGMRNLKQFLELHGAPATGWTLTEANDITSDGRFIAGTGINPQGQTEGWVASVHPQTLIRASVTPEGYQGAGFLTNHALADDAPAFAFDSSGGTWEQPDQNGFFDVFFGDLDNHAMRRMSRSLNGTSANRTAQQPVISANGEVVGYDSYASNLVAGDTNGRRDVFVTSVATRVNERVSVSTTGVQGNGNSYNATLSGDGRFVAFSSGATNLAAEDTNTFSGVFVRDRVNGTTECVSLGHTGLAAADHSYAVDISEDGRFVAFLSQDNTLNPVDTNPGADLFVRDRLLGVTELVSVDGSGSAVSGAVLVGAMSADGRFALFLGDGHSYVPNDTNLLIDAFVRDRLHGTTTRVSVTSEGRQLDRHVMGADLSPDGRFVGFLTRGALVAGDSNAVIDAFLHDRVTGLTERVSTYFGRQANAEVKQVLVSRHASRVAFVTGATNLVIGKTLNSNDVFIAQAPNWLPNHMTVRFPSLTALNGGATTLHVGMPAPAVGSGGAEVHLSYPGYQYSFDQFPAVVRVPEGEGTVAVPIRLPVLPDGERFRVVAQLGTVRVSTSIQLLNSPGSATAATR